MRWKEAGDPSAETVRYMGMNEIYPRAWDGNDGIAFGWTAELNGGFVIHDDPSGDSL